MRNRVTVRDVTRREYVGVNEGDPVRGAAELMYEDRVGSAIVLRGNDPVGALTSEDVLRLVAEDVDAEETTVGEVMREPVVSIRPDRPLSDAVKTIADRDVRQLVVAEDEEVLGVVSEHDILTARALFPESDAQEVPTTTAGSTEPVRDEDEQPEDPYNTQGVCEICGSFAGELRDVNGQLLCGDCRPV